MGNTHLQHWPQEAPHVFVNGACANCGTSDSTVRCKVLEGCELAVGKLRFPAFYTPTDKRMVINWQTELANGVDPCARDEWLLAALLDL